MEQNFSRRLRSCGLYVCNGFPTFIRFYKRFNRLRPVSLVIIMIFCGWVKKLRWVTYTNAFKRVFIIDGDMVFCLEVEGVVPHTLLCFMINFLVDIRLLIDDEWRGINAPNRFVKKKLLLFIRHIKDPNLKRFVGLYLNNTIGKTETSG